MLTLTLKYWKSSILWHSVEAGYQDDRWTEDSLHLLAPWMQLRYAIQLKYLSDFKEKSSVIISIIPPLFTVTNLTKMRFAMKTTDLAAVALSTLLWYTVTKKSLILAIKYNFNFLHFRAVKTILWRLCVYNPSVKNAAVSINADCLLISSVLQADRTDYFIPFPHTERNSTNTVIYNTLIFASRQSHRRDLSTKKPFRFVSCQGILSYSDFSSYRYISWKKMKLNSHTFRHGGTAFPLFFFAVPQSTSKVTPSPLEKKSGPHE